MKKHTSLVAALLLFSTMFWGVAAVKADETIVKVPVDLTSYCHIKFPPMREDTLSWEQPVLDTTAGDIIDFYGPCDYDPLGREEVWRQKQELYREFYSD